VEKFCKAGQATGGSMAHALCVLDNPRYKHSLLIAFPLQQWLHERTSFLPSTYTAHHHAHSFLQDYASCRLLFLSKQATCSPLTSPHPTLYQSFIHSVSADRNQANR
jgi:hypothetical protein